MMEDKMKKNYGFILGLVMMLVGMTGCLWLFTVAEIVGVRLSSAVVIPFFGAFPLVLFALGCLSLVYIGGAFINGTDKNRLNSSVTRIKT